MSKSIRQQLSEVQAKIAALQVKEAELTLKADSEVDLDAVQAGKTVTFNYGKAPNVRSLTGLVLGRKDPEAGAKGGSLVKVAIGEGFEAQVVTIYPQQVTAIAADPVAA